MPEAMQRARYSFWLSYGVALVVSLAALALKLMLIPLVTRDEPALIFFAAVMVSAALGGLGPGLFATVLCAGFDEFFFMQPFNRFELYSSHEVLRLGIFVVEAAFISLICARMKAAQRVAEKSAAEAQELEGRLIQISEAEQRRIGHDLHDGLSQHLTGIAMLARRLEENLRQGAPRFTQDASQLCGLAKSATELTRELCRTLSPAVLESAGLPEALRQLAGNAEHIFHVICTFELKGPEASTDIGSSVHLYRIAQEAINNAVRHGQARHIYLRLEMTSRGIVLQVEDDGVGFKGNYESAGGMGLRIMRYRAGMIGAAIEIARREQNGAMIICRLNSERGPADEKPWTFRKPYHQAANQESFSSKTTRSYVKD